MCHQAHNLEVAGSSPSSAIKDIAISSCSWVDSFQVKWGLLQIHTPTSWKAQQLCAECLGLLGAVDPARVEVALDPPDSLCRCTQELLTTLIVKHLVRLLRVASHIFVLDAASFAIQVSLVPSVCGAV